MSLFYKVVSSLIVAVLVFGGEFLPTAKAGGNVLTTFSKSAVSPSGFIAQGASNVVFAQYDIKASLEDVELQKLDFRIFKSVSPNITTLVNSEQLKGTVKVKLDGITLYSADGASSALYANDAPTTGVTLAQYGTITTNKTSVLTIEGNIKTDAPCGTTYINRIRGYTFRRLISNDTIATNEAAIDGNVLMVECASLAVSPNGALASSTIIAGMTNVKIGSFKLQAGGAEDLNVSSVIVKLKGVTSASKFHNLALKVGDKQYGGSVLTPSSMGDKIVTSGLLVTKNDTVIVDVYADIASDAAPGTVSACIPQNGLTAIGATSGNALFVPLQETCSSQQSIAASGTLNIIEEAGTPVTQQIIHAGEMDVDLMKFRVKVTNAEAVLLQKMTLIVVNGNGNVTAFKLLDKFGNQIGNTASLVVPAGDVGEVTFTGLNKTFMAADEQVLTAKATVTGSGVLTPGKLVRVIPSFFEYTGVSSGFKTLRSGGMFTSIAQQAFTNLAELKVATSPQFETGDWVRLDIDGDGFLNESSSGIIIGGSTSENRNFCLSNTTVNGEMPTAGTFGLRAIGATNGTCTGNYLDIGAALSTPGAVVAINYTGALGNSTTIAGTPIFVSRDQIVHDVEPVITVEGVSANAAPSTSQDMLKLKVTASGSRPVIVKSLEVLTSGSYVSATKPAPVSVICSLGGTASWSLVTGAPFDRYKITKNGTIITILSGSSMLLENFRALSESFSDVSAAVAKSKYVTLQNTGNCSGNLISETKQLGPMVKPAGLSGFEMWVNSDKKSVAGYLYTSGYATFPDNKRYQAVDLSSVQVNSGLKLLFVFGSRSGMMFTPSPVTIPAGTSFTFAVKANTSNVKVGISQGTVTAALTVSGDPGLGRLTGGGAASINYYKVGGLHWDYSNVKGIFGGSGTTTESQINPAATWGWANDNQIDPGNPGTIPSWKGTIDVSDSYPVVGPTFTY